MLAAAHAQGILHRDLKPDNVFLTDVGAVKVLDFGIARLREPQSSDSERGERSDSAETRTRTGVVLGTPQYMPPEQARGRASLVDERSDLWAVGAIAFAMLTGRHVHQAETPNEALLKAMTATAEPIAVDPPGVDPTMAAIVDRALAFDPAARYPNAQAMQADVRAAMGDARQRADGADPDLGGSLSGSKPVTAVTRSAVPIVRDTKVARSSGWRVLAVVAAIGACAVAGRAVLLHLAPQIHATSDEQASPAHDPAVSPASAASGEDRGRCARDSDAAGGGRCDRRSPRLVRLRPSPARRRERRRQRRRGS